MRVTASDSAAPMPSLAASAENPAPRPVVVTTRPRPFQLVGAVIWNPPTASTAGAAFTSASVPVAASSTNAAVDAANRASRSIAGPAPMPTFKAAPAPSIRSLLSGSFSESPSASPASASAQQPVPSMTWQQPPASHAPPAPAAPSHPFPRLPFALQRPDTSAPTSTITNNGSASSLRLTSFRGAPTAEAGRVEGHEAKQHEPAGQTGRGHASSGIQDRTGTASGLQAGNPPSASAAPAPAAPSPVPASVPVPIPVASAPAPHPLQHQPLRRGKWTKAEEEFAAATIRYFCSGLLNLQFGTLLRGFLAQQLHCHPMRISKKLLPGTTFCGVEISRKLGRRAYSPRWCDSPEATQQKLDAEAHLVQLREAFVASVEEEAAASTAADDSQDAKSAAAEAPPKSAGKARRSGPVPDEPEEEEEMKEAEDLYSRVSNVTMESATSPPHGETRAGSPGYYQPPPPPAPHQRVYQQLQPPYYVQQAPYYVQQVPYQVLQQQRQALQQPQPFDGRKRSRDELGACSVEPRGFHHPHPSQQQPVAAATTSFGSRSNHAGADEAHARNFGSPMPERQRFPQSSGAPQFHHQHQQQQQRPAAAASDHPHNRDQPGYAASYFSDKRDSAMGNSPPLQRAMPSPFQLPYSKTERSVGAPVAGGSAKGALPTQTEIQAPTVVPYNLYHIRSGFLPSFYGADEDTIMENNQVLPLTWGSTDSQPHHEVAGTVRSSGGGGGGFSGGAMVKNPSPAMLPKLPSLRASLQRASTYQQEEQQLQHQHQQHRMNM